MSMRMAAFARLQISYLFHSLSQHNERSFGELALSESMIGQDKEKVRQLNTERKQMKVCKKD